MTDNEDEDDEAVSSFILSMEIGDDGETMSVLLEDVPIEHVSQMFCTTIADVITTSLMDLSMSDDDYDDDDEDEE